MLLKTVLTLTAVTLGLAATTPTLAQDKILETKAWDAFVDEDNRGRKVCYIISIPEKTTTSQKVTSRGDTALIVTHRPYYGIEGQVEVKLGFTGNEDAGATMAADGKNRTNLFVKASTAWSYDDISDAKLVGMMKKGNKLLFTSTSRRGTVLKDTYSLSGFTAAYNSITKACK